MESSLRTTLIRRSEKCFAWTEWMRFIVLLIFMAFSSKAYAIEECDILGSLEVD